MNKATVAFVGFCTAMARSCLARGDHKSARSWLEAAAHLAR